MDGQGDKNSEEVSVDLSVESNFDRIQNWLDHVNINNKSRFSQSMLQLNSIRGNASESESKFQVNNAKHQTSDIHRYLTSFYNANDKSLRIGSKNMYSSEHNLSMTVQPNEDIKNSQHPKQIQSSSINGENSNGHLLNEIETVTIKLKPIVVAINDDHTDNSESNEGENISFNKKNTDDQDVLNQSTDDLAKDTKHIVPDPKSDSDGPFSNNEHLELSRSYSETSSESFESLHSSDSENKKMYKNTGMNILENESSSSIDIYENIQINHIDIEQKETETYQDTSKTNVDKNNYNQLNFQLIALDQLSKSQPDYLQSDKVDSQLFSNEKVNKQIEKTVNPIISKESVNLGHFSIGEITRDNEKNLLERNKYNQNSFKITTSHSSASSLNENDESYNENDKGLIIDKEQVQQEKNVSVLSNITSKVTEISKNIIKGYQKISTPTSKNSSKSSSSSSKSDSDINDYESDEFSEESVANIDQKDLPVQVITTKKNYISKENNKSIIPNLKIAEVAISEENKTKTNSDNNPRNNLYNFNQTELIDIFKQNLTKDDVVEKIVHTLFASVLRASAETHSEREIEFVNKMVPKKKIETEETVDELTSAGKFNYLQDSDIDEKALVNNQEEEINVISISAENETSKEIYSDIHNEKETEEKLKILNEGIHAPLVALAEEGKLIEKNCYSSDNNKTEIEEKLQIQTLIPSVSDQNTSQKISLNNDCNKTGIEEKIQNKIKGIYPVEDLTEEENNLKEICFNNDKKTEVEEKLKIQNQGIYISSAPPENKEKTLEKTYLNNDSTKTDVEEKIKKKVEGTYDPLEGFTKEEDNLKETCFNNNKKTEVEEKLQIRSDGIHDPVETLTEDEDNLKEICFNNNNKLAEVEKKIQIESDIIYDPVVVALIEKGETQDEVNSNNDNTKKIENIFNNESEFQKQEGSKSILIQVSVIYVS